MRIWISLACIGALLGLTSVSVEACQAFRKPIMDIQGNILVGTSVTITKTRGGALATLYSDRDCTSTTTNPVLTTTDGTFTVYVKDGVYTVTPVKSGYAFVTVTDVAIFDPVLENVIPNAQYSTVDITQASTGAIDSIGSVVATLKITQPATAISTKTIPSTLSLVFEGKGDLTISAGETLTINGPVTNSTDHAIFLGTGTFTFGSGAGPYPCGKRGRIALTYSAAMSPDACLATTFVITPSNGTAFAIAPPTHAGWNGEVCYEIRNTFGVLGAVTFTSHKTAGAFTQPANGFNREICFKYTGTVWKESKRQTVDVDN